MVLLPLVRSKVNLRSSLRGGFLDDASMAVAFALGAEGI
jgi:hypothetical protein